MRIHVGCELTFEFPQTTPMIAMLNVNFSRVSDLERPDHLMTNPAVVIEGYRDSFGNWCSRFVAPPGRPGRSAAPSPALADGNPTVPAWQSLLRNRPPIRRGLASLRTNTARLAA